MTSDCTQGDLQSCLNSCSTCGDESLTNLTARNNQCQMSFHSDTGNISEIPYSYPVGKCRPITASFGNHNVLVDRRNKQDSKFSLRMFSFEEMEKLFGFPAGYTDLVTNSKQKRRDLLGNSVIVDVVTYVFCQLLEYYM